MCVYCVENVSTALTYIALNALEILMPSVDSINIYSIWWYGWKALSLSFPKLLRIENRFNIKKVMGRNIWMCFVLTASTYIALNALEILVPYVDSINIYSIWDHCIQSRVFTPHYSVYSVVQEPLTPVLTVSTNNTVYTVHNSIALILCINCLDMPFNVHTTDKVTVSGFLTI